MDTDLISLGDLTTHGFFSMINWKNSPAAVRRPLRSEFGLDPETLALAKSIPFFVAGRPRVVDRNSVAAFLSECTWE